MRLSTKRELLAPGGRAGQRHGPRTVLCVDAPRLLLPDRAAAWRESAHGGRQHLVNSASPGHANDVAALAGKARPKIRLPRQRILPGQHPIAVGWFWGVRARKAGQHNVHGRDVAVGWVGTSILLFMMGGLLVRSGLMRSARVRVLPVPMAILSTDEMLSDDLGAGGGRWEDVEQHRVHDGPFRSMWGGVVLAALVERWRHRCG